MSETISAIHTNPCDWCVTMSSGRQYSWVASPDQVEWACIDDIDSVTEYWRPIEFDELPTCVQAAFTAWRIAGVES